MDGILGTGSYKDIVDAVETVMAGGAAPSPPCQSIQIRQQEIQQNDIWILCANCRNCVSAV